MSYNVREHSYVVGGLGVTGQACVRFLLQKQATVKAFDTRANLLHLLVLILTCKRLWQRRSLAMH